MEDSIVGQARPGTVQISQLVVQNRFSELSEDFEMENLGDNVFDQEIILPKRIT